MLKQVKERVISCCIIISFVFGLFSMPTATVRAENTISSPRMDKDGKITWDCIYYGNYYQNAYEPKKAPENPVNGMEYVDEDGTQMIYKEWWAHESYDDYVSEYKKRFSYYIKKEPIKWRILSKDGEDVFLISDVVLDVQPYYDYLWSTSILRNWLNTNFLNKAFTESEQAAIKDTTVDSDKGVVDKVYILSGKETTNSEYGFCNVYDGEYDYGGEVRNTAVNTNYAQSVGEWIQGSETEDGKSTGNYDGTTGKSTWWLRNDQYGSGQYGLDTINYMGTKDSELRDKKLAVRPVLHLDLSKTSMWSEADAINESGNVVTKSDLNESEDEGQYGLKNPRYIYGQGMVWDCLYFGNYPQSDASGNTMEPIKWRVLSVDGDDAFLISDKNLDAQPYAPSQITWENSTIREWLNDTFLKNAFSDSEQEGISQTEVMDSENSGSTLDSVFLLSDDEAKNPVYGFSKDEERTTSREAAGTCYITDKVTQYYSNYQMGGNMYWWLRGNVKEPSESEDSSSTREGVDFNGSYDEWGFRSYMNFGVRPVLHLNLAEASGWTYAGTVEVQGDVPLIENTPSPTPSTSPSQKGDVNSNTNSSLNVQSTVVKKSIAKPAKVKNLKLKKKNAGKVSKKTQYSLSWKKVKGATGYEVQQYINSLYRGKSSTKKVTKNIKKGSSLKNKKVFSVKKRSGKSEYKWISKVRVRAYKIVNGKKIYGSYSSWKTILTKKQVKKEIAKKKGV